jgi:serine protease AprX
MTAARRLLVVGAVMAALGPLAGAARAATYPAEPTTNAAAAPAPASPGTVATRALLAGQRLVDQRGRPLDGTGTSVAIIDTGIDPTHPAFRLPGGATKVVQVLSAAPCAMYGGDSPATSEVSDDPGCVVPVPTANVDAGHGGHGTMIGGIVAGDPYILSDGTPVGGIAPGARLVVISTTAALVGIDNAFRWVLAHHAAPCGAGVPTSVCPPIRVVNCSWGANSPVIARLQDALAREGVVTVWANGNTGGDGSTDKSNPDATLDPTPGVIAVASYDDLGTGTRHGRVSPTSSRGDKRRPQTWPAISAPGVNIISSCRMYQAICPAIETEPPRSGPGAQDMNTYFIGSGTSFAAPEVVGVVALLMQADPSATAAQIEDALKATAYKFADGARYQRVGRYTSSFDKGTGLVDAYAAALSLGARVRPTRAPRRDG